MADTGVNGKFHVSCDRITFKGQGTPPAEIILNDTVFNPGNPFRATFKLHEPITQPFTAFAVVILPGGSMLDALTLGPTLTPVASNVPRLDAGFTYPLLNLPIPQTAPKGIYEVLAAFFKPSKPITGREDARAEVSAKFTIE